VSKWTGSGHHRNTGFRSTITTLSVCLCIPVRKSARNARFFLLAAWMTMAFACSARGFSQPDPARYPELFCWTDIRRRIPQTTQARHSRWRTSVVLPRCGVEFRPRFPARPERSESRRGYRQAFWVNWLNTLQCSFVGTSCTFCVMHKVTSLPWDFSILSSITLRCDNTR